MSDGDDVNVPARVSPAQHAAAWTPAQVALLKRTIAKGCDDDELALFLHLCQRTGLDPFAKQIYAIKRWDAKAQREVMTPQSSIDGFRLVAQRTGECDGQDGPFWCGTDGIWRDVWLDAGPPVAAKVIAYRRGHAHGYVGIARFEAYAVRDRQDKLNKFWSTMAETMTAKVAEALALRKGFPAELSGLYTTDEMAQVGNESLAPRSEERRTITEPEGKRLVARAKAAGHDSELVQNWLRTRYGVTRLGEIRRADYDAILARVDDTTRLGDHVEDFDEPRPDDYKE